MHMMQQRQVIGRVQTFAVFQNAIVDQQFFNVFMTFFGQLNAAAFFIHIVMTVATLLLFVGFFAPDQVRYQPVDGLVHLGAVFGRTGDNQRGTGFINKNGVHFIDNGKVQATLSFVFQRERQAIAQIVKAEFVIGTVDDIGLLLLALLQRILTWHHHTTG